MTDSPPTAAELARKYDDAAPRWGDKMRMLGYYDAYLGLLSGSSFRARPGGRVLDIGSGTGAFAEAWVATHRAAQAVTLLDPSPQMLVRGRAALARRDVAVETAEALLEQHRTDAGYDNLLAAHILEHCPDPADTLRQMRRLVGLGARLWLVLSKPHWCNAIIWFQWRHRAYRPAEVTRMLAATGWELDMEYAFPAGPPSRTSRGYIARAV